MGISISYSDGSNQLRLVSQSRRSKRRNVAVSEMMHVHSDRNTSLDVKQNHSAIHCERVSLDLNHGKSSIPRHEDISGTSLQVLQKIKVITQKAADQQTKPTQQSIQTISTSQQMPEQTLCSPQPIIIWQVSNQKQEVEQNLPKLIDQTPRQSIPQEQIIENHIKRDALTVDLKRTPVKTWRQHVQRESMPEGRDELTIELKQVALNHYTQDVKNEREMQDYFKSQGNMPSMNVILSNKLAEQSSNAQDEQKSLKNVRETMRQLISGKININELNLKLKPQHLNIRGLQASKLAQNT